ncbi:MAG: protein-methionine-sulfoxide reductase catalytic subunit MsrP [Acidobacteriota bacterium]
MLIRKKAPWELSERDTTPEPTFQNRRQLIRSLGAGAGLLVARGAGALGKPARPAPGAAVSRIPTADLYPARRNEAHVIEEKLTPETVAARHNVFDEFALERDRVWKASAAFSARPWRIHVGGAVEKPLTFDADELIRKLGVEERLYRFRCVETWAMAVPWTGFPLRRLIELVRPLAAARYVRMVSAARPLEMPNWFGSRRVFPYYEALSLEEATHDLAFVATGIYGHPLPNQHGAPLRLVVPWKYGLKGIKSIVAFQLTRERPGTFWNELSPNHYSFSSNVDPSEEGQAQETVLDTGEVRPTRPYNGYGEAVAHLYA